jgi:hypothetical protein
LGVAVVWVALEPGSAPQRGGGSLALVVGAAPAAPDGEQHDRAVTVGVVGKPVHSPVTGDLQLAKPSGQAAAVRRCKLALPLVEQVEVEGDPAEVVVA